jgi:adenylate kinase
MKIIMIGAPGSGKGTQAENISETYHIPHISTGDIFRENVKQHTVMGEKAKKRIEKGKLVPNDLVVELVLDRLWRPDTAAGYVLDGFPRKKSQAKALTKALKEHDDKIDVVIDIEVPDDVIASRLSGRRSCSLCQVAFHIQHSPPIEDGICDVCGGELILRYDDEPEIVKKRVKIYHRKTEPLIEYYKENGILRVVDGTRDIETIFEEIKGILPK